MTKPKPCQYDRELGYRIVKREHLDPLPDHHPDTCPGCQPCEEGHCAVCGRRHVDAVHPQTCPDCVGGIRDDLVDIRHLCAQLRGQAAYAADDGRPWAAAPIPGAAAMVLIGPSTDPDQVIADREYLKTHRSSDPVPPLAVLARWEELWADWLGQTRDGRTTISRTVGYLDEHLTRICQQSGHRLDDQDRVLFAPDVGEFSRAVAGLRVELERVLHDETEPEQGVECFECGARLVRRIRDPKRCHHRTEARDAMRRRLLDREAPKAWLQVLAFYQIPSWPEEREAARLPSPAEVAAARLPCPKCDQGGVKDPRPGISWECPSCRKAYTPGEYATAVRQDLADRELIARGNEVASAQSMGWTDLVLAADAASTLTGHAVLATTLRKWMDRGKVASCCAWTPRKLWGRRLVFWPDVADEAVAAVQRAVQAAEARRRKAEREAAEEAEQATAAEADEDAADVTPEGTGTDTSAHGSGRMSA